MPRRCARSGPILGKLLPRIRHPDDLRHLKSDRDPVESITYGVFWRTLTKGVYLLVRRERTVIGSPTLPSLLLAPLSSSTASKCHQFFQSQAVELLFLGRRNRTVDIHKMQPFARSLKCPLDATGAKISSFNQTSSSFTIRGSRQWLGGRTPKRRAGRPLSLGRHTASDRRGGRIVRNPILQCISRNQPASQRQ